MAKKAAASMRHRIGQAAAIAGLLVYAAATLLSGTDRESRKSPTSPAFVGWPYDTGGARALAIVAFVKYGPRSALGFARKAILSDPISAQAVSVLGQSQLYSGQAVEANKTFKIAGRLGWRDAMTQIYWLDQAVQAGDMKVAAERLDAILRQDRRYENRDRFLAVVSATPEGRAALAKRLALLPSWADTYVSELKDVPENELTQRADVVRLTGRGVWDCGAIAPMTQRLIDTGMLDAAQSAWRQNCATSASLVYDGGFDQLDTTKAGTGFEWHLTNRGDVDILATQDSSGNRRLELEVNAPQSVPVIRQLIVLKPGRYRLTWRTPETTQKAAGGLTISLACTPSMRDAQPGMADGAAKDMHVQEFVVDSSCAVRELVFWLAPKSQIHLDDIALR